ncbi:cytochrome c [Dokdonella sp.]|uniref:c-type cytochrome n=1 Tax=Dokdonella sp. TaxID=2291710 RepID=UPI0035279652
MKSTSGILKSALTLLILVALGAGIFIWSGVYNIGADDPHMRATHMLLETLRERSIESRASKLTVPDLSDPAKALQGAGNYNAMCVGCHLAPGMVESELSKGLYPAPPNLSKYPVELAQAFWVIKHGIKASGMPAWGKSMEDAYIWNMAAFLQKLPTLDANQYQAMVASSGGHSHGGGESGRDLEHEVATNSEAAHDDYEGVHSHESGEGDEHNDSDSGHHHDNAAMQAEDSVANAKNAEAHGHDDSSKDQAMTTHTHADGTVESHPVKPEVETDDGHDHKH